MIHAYKTRLTKLTGLLLAFALPVAAATKECKYAAGPHSDVSVTNQNGNVTVKPSASRQILISATPASDKVTVDCAQVGTRIDAISRPAAGANDEESRVDYEVSVPADSIISVRNASGPIHFDGAGEDVTLRGDSASVDASNLRHAHLHVVTVNGPVTLSNISGGHIEVLSTGGNVHLQNVDAQRLSVSTTTGNIAYDGNFGEGGEYSLTNNSGNIDVALPASASIDIDARSVRGSVQNDFPLQQKSHAAPAVPAGRAFAGTSHSGSSSVELRSFSGTIRVKKR